ncbi:relaxase/mobilization nuclease domain-containing protein [Leisingera sp. M658]|uniref:relaxase/mobilization nuclease domain-containing protein n=1 Tax=Leisingera sp. M658 TaxID=2867015 RepID=UPI0021A36EF8|nr:relaxase/mobilization nuclease domain-containing protein [Leisingera sp. M658]UWQ73615.1 relaxase/mobilization nuclease domain-containing protein [Leisingera sp. M658]
MELFDLRGFAADDLTGAMQECEAVARGTRCQKHLFSLSLNPPEHEDVPVEAFEAAIARAESRLGLEDQPRAIVFHEKEGRRHAHAVWSRIDEQRMKAIELPYYKTRLNEVSRELYLEHGWRMPDGFKDKKNRDPLSFTLEEWQQAKRTKQDPREVKSLIRECWSGSDDRKAFEAALRENGYWLARGNKRGFVAVDWRGEVYSLSRMTGAKTKELKTRLGDPKELLPVDMAKAQVAAQLTPKLKAWAKEERAKAEKANLAATFQRDQMVQRQRKIRDDLKRKQQDRWLTEEKARAARTPTGIRGLWGWITGKNRKIRNENETDIARALGRDRSEKQDIIRKQLAERRTLQRQVKLAREKQQAKLQELNRDVALAMKLRKVPEARPEPQRGRSLEADRERGRDRSRSRDDDYSPN